jgi:hypothetical protein
MKKLRAALVKGLAQNLYDLGRMRHTFSAANDVPRTRYVRFGSEGTIHPEEVWNP